MSGIPSGASIVNGDASGLKMIKVTGSDRYIAGYANVAEVADSQNDIIGLDTLKMLWDKWSSNPDLCVIPFYHGSIPVAKVVFDPVMDSEGVIHKSGVDSKGLYVVAKFRDDISVGNKIWEKVISGVYRGFSIGADILRSVKDCSSGRCLRRILDGELAEVSVVDYPSNRPSIFTTLKSSSGIDDLMVPFIRELLRTPMFISTTKNAEGKLSVFVEGDNSCPIKKYIVEKMNGGLASTNSQLYSIVNERDSTLKYVPLFDETVPESLINPATEDGGMLALTLSPINKPIVGEPTVEPVSQCACKVCTCGGTEASIAKDVIEVSDVNKSAEVKPVAPVVTLQEAPVQVPAQVVAPVVIPAVVPTPVPVVSPVIVPTVAEVKPEVKPVVVSPPVTPPPVVIAPELGNVVPVIQAVQAPQMVQPIQTQATETVLVQRGKAVQEAPKKSGLDLLSLHKMSWKEISDRT